MSRLKKLCAVSVAAALALGGAATADAWPTRPVTVVVPFAAGGPTDVQARLVAEQLSAKFGQQFIIENRAGAGGNVGATAVARAEPDGYTLLAGTVGTHAINEFLYARTGFDPAKDFVPLALIGSGPNVLIVNAESGLLSLRDLVERAKREPGKLNYGSPGAGTSNHLAMELFKARGGLEVQGVTYRGAGPALTDVIAGHVVMMFNGIDNALPAIRSGKVRALAISAAERSPALPDVPTLIELGFPDFLTASWTVLFAPAGTPAAIVQRLNRDSNEIVSSGKVAERYRDLGLNAPALSLPELEAFIASERKRWQEAVRISGAKVE